MTRLIVYHFFIGTVTTFSAQVRNPGGITTGPDGVGMVKTKGLAGSAGGGAVMGAGSLLSPWKPGEPTLSAA